MTHEQLRNFLSKNTVVVVNTGNGEDNTIHYSDFILSKSGNYVVLFDESEKAVSAIDLTKFNLPDAVYSEHMKIK